MRWMRVAGGLVLMAGLGSGMLAYGQKKDGAFGKAKEAARDKQTQEDRERNDRTSVGSIIFRDRDRDIIRDYYRGGNSNLPPGLAKRGGKLPPGLQKHIAKNGTLPPGLQKRLTPLPYDLDRRLPRLPDGYGRGTIGSDVVIVDRRTQRVMDVIHDIIRP